MGIPELIIILIVALVVIGPKDLPRMARDLGSTVRGLRRTADDFKETLEEEIGLSDRSDARSSRGKKKGSGE